MELGIDPVPGPIELEGMILAIMGISGNIIKLAVAVEVVDCIVEAADGGRIELSGDSPLSPVMASTNLAGKGSSSARRTLGSRLDSRASFKACEATLKMMGGLVRTPCPCPCLESWAYSCC